MMMMMMMIHLMLWIVLIDLMECKQIDSLEGLRGGRAGIQWSDWDGQLTCNAFSFETPSSESAIRTIVKSANENGRKIQVVGAGHSFSQITLHHFASYVSLDLLREPISMSSDGIATVYAGMRLFELNEWLFANNRALPNLGATTEQSIAGAISTGTHGTGRNLGSLSTAVMGFRLITANGTVIDVDTNSQGILRNIFNAGRVGLGALGVITRVSLKTVPKFILTEDLYSLPIDALLEKLPRIMEEHERVQYYFYPVGQEKNATLIIRTAKPNDATIVGCWDRHSAQPPKENLEFGTLTSSCTDWSYKALSDSRDGYFKRKLYTEMEMFVPAHQATEAVQMVRQAFSTIAAQQKISSSVFLGVRYVAKDTIWLSPQYDRDTAVLSIIVEGTTSTPADLEIFNLFAKTAEDITERHFDGIPHWGKRNFATYDTLISKIPHLNDFIAIRNKLDPLHTFSNPYVSERLRGARTQMGVTQNDITSEN